MPTVYRRGAIGPEVLRIQQRLYTLGHYHAGFDGQFGGATESAVVAFQRSQGLQADGQVGPLTWGALFPAPPSAPSPVVPPPTITTRPLLDRCLELTGAFETGQPPPGCYARVSGDFDGQGLSYGCMQWNFGQQSLPPLFARLDETAPGVLEEVFHGYAPRFRAVLKQPRAAQLQWARSIQTPRHRLIEPWAGLFKALGLRPEFQAVQRFFAQKAFDSAVALARTYGLRTERAAALMFDIITQNGSIRQAVQQRIRADFAALAPSASEQKRLEIVANRRADAAYARWREDVRRRKLTIARGEGWVHGQRYHLETGYHLRLVPTLELA